MTDGRVFVCGMLRSGTTLAQTLLTNHPRMLVAYQPFHQLYVDVKQMFLQEHGFARPLPLDDGNPASRDERELFQAWLGRRRFDAVEAMRLARRSTGGKGGGEPELDDLVAAPGSFLQVRDALHDAMAQRIGDCRPAVVGSKEILCEEFLPHLVDAGVRCVLIVRDPRGVIASANNGSYRDMVGDRYPLMMLVRLWRKSAAYWLRYQHDPRVCTVRYEDLVTAPDRILDHIAAWLGQAPFPPATASRPLADHRGRPWQGNSSFGAMSAVDARAVDSWRTLLRPEESRFIGACTRWELERLGYAFPGDLGAADIAGFREDVSGVRPTYLATHPIDDAAKQDEVKRLALADSSPDPRAAGAMFLFADRYQSAGTGAAP